MEKCAKTLISSFLLQQHKIFHENTHIALETFVFYRKASLSLIRKMLHYIEPELLTEMTGPEFPSPNFASSLTEVLSVILDVEVNTLVVQSQD